MRFDFGVGLAEVQTLGRPDEIVYIELEKALVDPRLIVIRDKTDDPLYLLVAGMLSIANRFGVVELDIPKSGNVHEPCCEEAAHQKLVVVGHVESAVATRVVVGLACPRSNVI